MEPNDQSVNYSSPIFLFYDGDSVNVSGISKYRLWTFSEKCAALLRIFVIPLDGEVTLNDLLVYINVPRYFVAS